MYPHFSRFSRLSGNPGEGNVFSGICLLMGKEFHVVIIHDALDLTVQPPLPILPILLVISGGQEWSPVHTCSLDMWWLATEAHVRIRWTRASY